MPILIMCYCPPCCLAHTLTTPLSLSLSFCCLHLTEHPLFPFLIWHLAWAVVAAIVASRRRMRDFAFRSTCFCFSCCLVWFSFAHPATAAALLLLLLPQDVLSASRFYLFVFIIQQNQLRLHPVPVWTWPLCLNTKLVASRFCPFPSLPFPSLPITSPAQHTPNLQLRLAYSPCCWLWLQCRRDVYIYGLLFPYVLSPCFTWHPSPAHKFRTIMFISIFSCYFACHASIVTQHAQWAKSGKIMRPFRCPLKALQGFQVTSGQLLTDCL